MEMIHTCEYTSEQRITTQTPAGNTDLPRKRIQAPAAMFSAVRRILLLATPRRTGMVAKPVAESPVRSLMSGSTEATNVQENMNMNVTRVAVPGVDPDRYTGNSEKESPHAQETTMFFMTGISFNRWYSHPLGRIGTL
jgi:hypothetical protein